MLLRWCSDSSLVACGGLAGVVGIAYAVGRASAWELIPVGSLAAVALSGAALFQRHPVERVAGAALLVWLVLATLTEQFDCAARDHGVLVAVAWLVLPIAGGAVLPAAGHWWSGLGCWAATFAGVAATTFSAHHVHAGAGLFVRWLF